MYLHLHRISNSFFFPGNLSTFTFTEFKKNQGHIFSILNFWGFLCFCFVFFFKLSVVAAAPSRYLVFILSYLLLQTPATRAAPSCGHTLAFLCKKCLEQGNAPGFLIPNPSAMLCSKGFLTKYSLFKGMGSQLVLAPS